MPGVLTETSQLRRKAYKLRRDVVEMVYRAKSGHPGGALGVADILAVLFYRYLRHRPAEPDWPARDRFVLSNGHICPILYAILADRGYFPRQDLWTFRKLGSHVQGHPSVAKGTPGVEYSGGSLGIGLSYAQGMALASRLGDQDYRAYCMVSDGDCQEGQLWEAAMSAVHHRVGNLIAMVDYNRTQIDGPNDEIMSVAPLAAKWQAFGWQTLTINGHDYDQIIDAFEAAHAETERPSVIVADTVIGKGVSFMEGDYHWHHGYPDDDQYEIAMTELEAAVSD